jgi:hypothetical protein
MKVVMEGNGGVSSNEPAKEAAMETDETMTAESKEKRKEDEEELMDTSTEETEEDLIKKADKMLESPISNKGKNNDSVSGPRTNSVSSLVSSLNITGFVGVPVKVLVPLPAQAPLVNLNTTPARIQSDPGTDKKSPPRESLVGQKINKELGAISNDTEAGKGEGRYRYRQKKAKSAGIGTEPDPGVSANTSGLEKTVGVFRAGRGIYLKRQLTPVPVLLGGTDPVSRGGHYQ